MKREGIKENDGWGEFNSDIRIFVNATVYPQ
jgi:transcription initiation factor IIF auxiliary subunit